MHAHLNILEFTCKKKVISDRLLFSSIWVTCFSAQTCMRALVSNTGLFNNSEQIRGHGYDLLWGYCPQGDTELMLHWSSKKAEKKWKIDALSRIKQSPPQPSDTWLWLWGQHKHGDVITVQREEILFRYTHRKTHLRLRWSILKYPITSLAWTLPLQLPL